MSGADHRPDRGASGEADAGAGEGNAGIGSDPDEVLAWFSASERYGPSVLAEPPRSGFYLIAWIVPGVVVVAALAGGLLTLRAMRGRRADDDEHSAASDTDELQPYLDAVDRDLALDGRDAPEEA